MFKLEPGQTAHWLGRSVKKQPPEIQIGNVIMQIKPGIAVTAEKIRQALIVHDYDPIEFNGDPEKFSGVITRESYLIVAKGQLNRRQLFRIADNQIRIAISSKS